MLPHREAARLEGVHVAEHGAWRPRRPEREDLIDADGIHRRLDLAAREQRLGFGREHQVPAHDAVEQRSHAEAVPHQKHRFRATVVDRERELAVQPVQHPGAPLLVPVHEDFRIAARAEAVSGRDQLLAELQVVVDLAVVHDEDGAVLVAQRLRAAGDVDDAEPHVGEADPRPGVAPAAVGAAVAQGGRHAVEGPGRDAARLAPGDPREPAHQAGSRSRSVETSGTGSTSSGGRCR